jgi:hypothetical protein
MKSTIANKSSSLGGRTTLYWLALALAIAGANLANQASLDFSLLSGLFIVFTYLTVSALGGLWTLMGVSVAFLAMEHVIVACFSKFILGEPIEARLENPTTTMGIYCVGMASMAAAAWFASKINLGGAKVLFAPTQDASMLRRMAIIGFFCECMQLFVVRLAGTGPLGQAQTGGVLGLIRAMTFLPPLAVACATASVIIRTEARRSFDAVSFLTMFPPVVYGVVGAGRWELALSLIAYGLTAFMFRFRFRPVHYAGFAAVALLGLYILFPYVIVARAVVRGPDMMLNLTRGLTVLEDVVSNPLKYQQTNFHQERVLPPDFRRQRFFDPPRPNLERFSAMKLTDAVAAGSIRRGAIGWASISPGFTMLVPAFILPNKPILGTTNMLAHLTTGILAPDDYGTQVTTGFFVDGFVSFRWTGVVIASFLIMLAYLGVYRLLVVQNLRQNVWGVCLAFTTAHVFSETTIQSQMLQIFQVPIAIVLVFAGIKLGGKLLEPKQSKLRLAQVQPVNEGA